MLYRHFRFDGDKLISIVFLPPIRRIGVDAVMMPGHFAMSQDDAVFLTGLFLGRSRNGFNCLKKNVALARLEF